MLFGWRGRSGTATRVCARSTRKRVTIGAADVGFQTATVKNVKRSSGRLYDGGM